MTLRGQSLTAQELRVLEALASLHSTNAVADELGLHQRTVQNCLRTAAAKLGARTHAEALSQLRGHQAPLARPRGTRNHGSVG